jgi:hypothetical protein
MVALARQCDLWLKRQPLQTPLTVFVQSSVRKPFLGFSSVFIALAVPSGSIPGGGEGGRRWSPCSGGGGKEPDRVSCQMFMVLSVKFENCFSLSCFADVLCISYPTDVSKGQEINPSII